MSEENQDDLLVDTVQMNEEKRQAMEVAESARESSKTQSFATELFMGRFDLSLLEPFPRLDPAVRAEGDAFMKDLEELLKTHINPAEVDDTRTIPDVAMKALAELGVFAMKVPSEYGGLGFSQVTYNRVMRMISSYCASTAVLVSAHQSIGVPQPLKMFGTEAQKKKYLPRFRAGAISAFALTEENVGSDPAQMETYAELSEDKTHYILNGTKLWCTNGLIADVMVVMARTPSKMVRGKERKQISAFIVDKEMEGIEYVSRCDFMGIRGIQNGVIKFKNIKVPKENLLWEEGKGLKLALMTLNTGRLTLPAACTGLAKKCLMIVRDWGKEREQWGAPIGKHEFGAQKIASIASMTFAMDAITWLTSHWADDKSKEIRVEAAMAKLFCTEASWIIINQTMQLRGGRGYEREESLRARGEKPYPVERMMRDSRINLIIEGTSEVMKLFLSREALDEHLTRAKDLLSPHTSLFKKAKAVVSLSLFYAKWYPCQWINASLWVDYEEYGELSCYMSYVDRTSHRMARTLFHAMMCYQAKLEEKQTILGPLMDIGTELFAMATTCSYARKMMKENPENQSPMELANYFCLHAQNRIEEHFQNLKYRHDEPMKSLADKILEDEMTWLEKGVI
jgi:alkylation response protein AidB-like acyl-CoA dehydrogenase